MPQPAAYPAVAGGKLIGVNVHAGPANYTQVTPGNPVAGGDLVYASEFPFGQGIDWLSTAVSDDGAYLALPIFNNTQTGSNRGSQSSVTVKYLVVATMAEVAAAANLSARSFRFLATGQ